jgi:hypothetical protein
VRRQNIQPGSICANTDDDDVSDFVLRGVSELWPKIDCCTFTNPWLTDSFLSCDLRQ